MWMRSGVAIGVAIACCGWAVPVGADTVRVGVVPTVTVNVTEAEAQAVAGDLGRALATTLRVDVVAGREVSRRIPADRELEQCFAQSECVADVGSRLDADQLLFLVVIRVGDSVQVDPVWVDVASSRNVSRASIVIEEGADRAELFAAAASSLLPDADPRPPAESTPEATAGGISADPGGDERAGRRVTSGVWVAGGVAIAALGVGIGFGASALSLEGELEDDGCDVRVCPNEQERVDSARTRSVVADVMFGVAAAGAITAGILYWRSGGDHPAAISVIPTASGMSVTIGVDF